MISRPIDQLNDSALHSYNVRISEIHCHHSYCNEPPIPAQTVERDRTSEPRASAPPTRLIGLARTVAIRASCRRLTPTAALLFGKKPFVSKLVLKFLVIFRRPLPRP